MDNSNKYKSSEELKAFAKEHLFDKYGAAISACIIVNMIILFVYFFSTIFINTRTLYGVALNFLISFVVFVLAGLFVSGEKYFYLKLVCGRPVTLNDVFYGFKLFPNKAVLIQLYIGIWIFMSMLPMTVLSYMVMLSPKNAVLSLFYWLTVILFGVVTVMVLLIYSQAFYLLHDFPDYSVGELLSTSRNLMKGNKGRLFYLSVSFIPLWMLVPLSCGFVCLWLIPYMDTAYTEFFLDLIQKQQKPRSAS